MSSPISQDFVPSGMTSQPPPVHVHALSKKSTILCRDTFVFWPKPVKLLVGLNQKITSVTSVQFHRWMRLIDPKTSEFFLRPIVLAKHAPFLYSATTDGPPVSPKLRQPFPPGDYGWFNADGSECPPFYDIDPLFSFEETKTLAEEVRGPKWDDKLLLYPFPPSLEQSVLLRDKHCFITGTEASGTNPDLGVSWIYPPAWVFQVTFPRKPCSDDYAPFLAASNAGLMRQDLIPLFHDNAFGVDVDDEYRIVVFRDLGSITLPSNLPRTQACAGPDDKFLREHFSRCLTVHLFGGDIWDDYHSSDIANAAEELGLCDDPSEMLPLDDERWNTVLGKELLEDHIRTELIGTGIQSRMRNDLVK